jgi:hypothetical protein
MAKIVLIKVSTTDFNLFKLFYFSDKQAKKCMSYHGFGALKTSCCVLLLSIIYHPEITI